MTSAAKGPATSPALVFTPAYIPRRERFLPVDFRPAFFRVDLRVAFRPPFLAPFFLAGMVRLR